MDIKLKIFELIDYQSKSLVGMLCKRLEILEQEKVLTPNLYKSIVKEFIYESSRQLKKLIEVYFTVGKIEFKSPKGKSL